MMTVFSMGSTSLLLFLFWCMEMIVIVFLVSGHIEEKDRWSEYFLSNVDKFWNE